MSIIITQPFFTIHSALKTKKKCRNKVFLFSFISSLRKLLRGHSVSVPIFKVYIYILFELLDHCGFSERLNEKRLKFIDGSKAKQNGNFTLEFGIYGCVYNISVWFGS